MSTPERPDSPLRIAVVFDSAGFQRTLPLSGAAARTVHLNAALHARGCPTTLLLCDLNPDSHPSGAWPLPVRYLDYTDVYERPDHLVTQLREIGPEVLVMSNTELTVRYGRALSEATGAALVYEMHDDEAGMLASIGSQPAECRAAALLQGAAVVSADGVIVFTDRDAVRASELGARQVNVVPCGATLPHQQTSAENPVGQQPPGMSGLPRVGFAGNLYYEPNLRALRYLATRLAPHLGERAVIDVFGRYPPAARTLGAGVVALHGPVGDLPRTLARMTIGVAPLDSGGGMKLKTLDYLAAGLPVVGTDEAFRGIDHPERVALISHDPTMHDLPGLVDILLENPALRATLGARSRHLVAQRYCWDVIAGRAHGAYQAIATAARAAAARGHPPPRRPSREVIELAWRTPYWLTEWRARDPRPQDSAPMTDQAPAFDDPTNDRAGQPPGGATGELAEEIDCARLAARAALGITFDTQAAVGYAGRSMVFFAPHAVLKVYTHRASERAHREVTGIELVARHASGLRVSEVLGHDDVPGGLSWVATSRLPGSQPSPEEIATSSGARRLGRIAARLHAIPGEHLGALAAHDRRIRELPTTDLVGADAGRRLVEALQALEPLQRPRCERGFVHGDLSSRNVLLSPDDEFAGVIDFEGCGLGCIYDDLATLVMQDGLLGPADPDHLLAGYQDERAALGHPHPPVDHDHLSLHLGWRARWILQWAIEIDRPLTEGVLALTPGLLAALARLRDRSAG